MYRTVLVPLDGTPLAERALPLANTVARAAGARVILLRAVETQPAPGIDVGVGPSAERELREAEEYLSEVARRLPGLGIVETAVFRGDATDAVLEETRVRRVDLLVMATRARSGLDRLVHGSVAEAVLARTPVPVLLVRGDDGVVAPQMATRPRLIVPLDGSSFSEEVLPIAAEMATRLGAEIVLTQCVPAPDRPRRPGDGHVVAHSDQRVDALETRARDYLHGVAARLASTHGVGPVRIDVRVGLPAESIAQAASEHDAMLVVMATHGRNGLARMLMGSVADAVLHHGQVPLLLVRPALMAQVV